MTFGLTLKGFFDTKSEDFGKSLEFLCNGTSSRAKDVLTLKLGEAAAKTGKKPFELSVSVKIELCIHFYPHSESDFEGECRNTFVYKLEPTAPSLFAERFYYLQNEIFNLILERYQKNGFV